MQPDQQYQPFQPPQPPEQPGSQAQPPQQIQPVASTTMPTPSAPPAPTPVFGQGVMYQAPPVEQKFPIWVGIVLGVVILGAAGLLTSVIVFMR